MADPNVAGLTLSQLRAVNAAVQMKPEWSEGLWRDIYAALPTGSSWTNQQVEGAIETALATHGLAQTMPELMFMFSDVLPTLEGDGGVGIGAQLGTQNARMLLSAAGVLVSAASMPDARITAGFGGAGGMMVGAS